MLLYISRSVTYVSSIHLIWFILVQILSIHRSMILFSSSQIWYSTAHIYLYSYIHSLWNSVDKKKCFIRFYSFYQRYPLHQWHIRVRIHISWYRCSCPTSFCILSLKDPSQLKFKLNFSSFLLLDFLSQPTSGSINYPVVNSVNG